MILTQNEIDTVKDISSLEELKSYILNSSVNTELNHISSDNISIRILSKEEYDKYIKNGTADGAISQNNENVWHINSLKSNVYVSGGYVGNKDQIIYVLTHQLSGRLTNMLNNLEANLKDYNNWVYDTERLTSKTYTINVFMQLLQDNALYQNNNVIPQNIKNYALSVSQYDHDIFAMQYVSSQITESRYNKSDSTTTTNSVCATADAYYSRYHCINYTYLNYKLSSCFRPVFQYKDNNKSKNIYC